MFTLIITLIIIKYIFFSKELNMNDLNIFFNSQVEVEATFGTGPQLDLFSLGDLPSYIADRCFTPIRCLFDGTKVKLSKGKVIGVVVGNYAEFDRHNRNFLHVIASVIFLVPGLIIGSFFRSLSYCWEDIRAQHRFAVVETKPLFHFGKVEYKYFNDAGKLDRVTLNLFQRILRRFGCYSHTHLQKVAKKALKTCYTSQILDNEKAPLLALSQKANQVLWYKGIKYECELGKVTLPSGEMVTYKGDLNSSSYDLLIELKNKDKTTRTARISLTLPLEKPMDGVIRSLHIHGILELSRSDNSFHEDTTHENNTLAKVTYQFLAKMLVNSKVLQKIDMHSAQAGSYYIQGNPDIATKYGFAQVKKDGTKLKRFSDGEVEDANDAGHFELTQDKAAVVAKECLVETSASLDFLLTGC